SPYLGRRYSECEQWRTEALDRLEAERPKLIILSMSRRYGADFGFTAYDADWIQSLTDLVAGLRKATGARVLVLGPVPDPHDDVPVCLSGSFDDALGCAPDRAVALNPDGIAAEAHAVGVAGGQYADLSQLFCTHDLCPAVVGRNLVFRDDNHVTVSYAQTLAPVLGMIAEQAIAPRS
ncbi:MAG: SGNH hydrolase domain-containing protein, partial [Mycobacterium sp.]